MALSRSRARLAVLAGAAALALSSPGVVQATTGAEQQPDRLPVGLSRLLHEGTPTGRAVATFGDVPTTGQVSALRRLGLTVQPMHRLPLALVAGPVAAMRSAVTAGVADDVYPDEKIDLLDTRSSDAMGAARPRAAGLTGKGVTVAVVDSGCDATQPDLADHVKHNVSLVSAEYANGTPDSSNTLVVPMDKGPYSNTDLGSGHGTHVAGIIAADSTSAKNGSRYGVAPNATLDCLAIGQVLFTTAVVTAYDYLLDQPHMWGVDVVNNSWGNSYRQFDPRDPVAVATRAVARQGATVVFAAGNSGSEKAQMSLNPFSQSPWVLSVAAGTLDRHRGGFSSNGLVFDNSRPTGIAAGGHTAFRRDRIGLVHPDVTAPGVNISSTCDSTGTVVGPCPPGENTEASGTSMASPHIAGAAAVLEQARPALTPAQVRLALEATASPVTSDGKSPHHLPFWQVGYGYVNLGRAVRLVRSDDWRSRLAAASARSDSRVRSADGYRVRRSDFWTYDAPRLTAGGSDSHTYRVRVRRGVTALKVSLAHPSLGSLVANLSSYTVTVRGPRGKVVGTTHESATAGSGTATAFLRLRSLGAGPGTYRLHVSGQYAASDPDTLDSDSLLGRMVTLQVAQLRRG